MPGSAEVSAPARPSWVVSPEVFDLTPTADEQALVAAAAEFAREVLRPAAQAADEAAAAPPAVVAASRELGLDLLGVPTALGGLGDERGVVGAVLVAEALATGDPGLAVTALAPGAVATALSLWGSVAQQRRLRSWLDRARGGAALALGEPTVLFDVHAPATTARRRGEDLLLDGAKSLVPRAMDAEWFLVGAVLDGRPVLVLVDRDAPGVEVAPEPAMGVRGAGLGRLTLRGVTVPAGDLVGDPEGTAYAQCVRLSRLAWCALGVGTAQAVLDHVRPYVNERLAFGEPISHRQSVAFMVADLAIELQAMRLMTYRAAALVARGSDAAREIGLAHTLCAAKAMRIGLDGVQLLGGHGYVKEHPVERWYRDLRALGVMEGGVLV